MRRQSRDRPETASFARSGSTHPLGKCEEARLEIQMPSALRDRLAAVATIKGKSVAEWARETLEKQAEGELVFMQRRSGND